MKIFTIFKNKYHLFVICTLLFATILRFYNYDNRWGIAYDQAHDALVARYAVSEFKIPLLGPFSSAGPFQTGGEWYWLLMIPTALFPYSFLTPWVFMTLLYVIFVGIMMRVAYKLEGKAFSIVVGVFSAISTAQLAQGVNLTNQSPQSIYAILSILFMITYLESRKNVFLFLTSLIIGLAATTHLQGVALIMMLVVLLFFIGPFSLKKLSIIGLGLFLPLLPILIYDIGHDFFNVKNMFYYYVFDQYKISLDVLGRRWLTFAGVFIAKEWSHIIGGYEKLYFLQIALILLSSIFLFIKNKLSREWVILTLSTFLMIGILRYTRTPLFESYLVFLHPFIILISCFALYSFFKFQKIIGGVIIAVLLVFTFYKDVVLLQGKYNYTRAVVEEQKTALLKKFPNEKFAVYDWKFKDRDKSAPLTLMLDADNKISDDGRAVGVAIQESDYLMPYPVILGERGAYQLFDLSATSSAALKKDKWVLVNPSAMYTSTQEWYTEEKK